MFANEWPGLDETPLFELLQAEESAAAVEAAKIRELKATGIEPDSDPLKELERNLNAHLDAAFDLKLQLEERQVKALQTRLSQLESQIGQRKQLRDKIIARRAAELIDGGELEWSSQDVVASDVSVKLAEAPVAMSPDSGDLARNRAWEILGLRLDNLRDEERTEISNKAYPGTRKPVRYKGGLRVVTVRSKSVASRFIQEGDILLGLDGFETLGITNISYILRDARLSNAAPMECQILRKGSNPIEGTLSLSNTREFIPVVGSEGADPNIGPCPLASPPPPVDALRELERQRGIEPGAISNNYELHKDSIRIVVEPVFDHIDPPRTMFPLAGRASLHRLRWRVTVTFKPKVGVTWPFKERADGKFEETFHIDAVHWHKLDEQINTKSPIEELRTPEQFQADLEPFLRNVKSCEQRLSTQEAVYYKDKSNAAELQAAWDALMHAEVELKTGAAPIDNAIRVVREQHGIARETSLALHKKQVLKLSLLAKGEATEAEVEAARKACVSFEEIVETFTARLHLLSNLLKSIPQRRDHEKYFQGCTSAKELSPSTDNHDPVDALIWLEAAFDAKLEFVKFDNLNLPIKAALRVRESTDKYQPDDLIIAIKGYSFETFAQAVTAALSDRPSVPNLLRGGLLGDVYPGNFDGKLRHLRHSGGSDVTFNLEVPLVVPESGETRIRYLQGICVSLEGLAVVPSLITSIEEGKSIKIYGTTRGTASVVAIDEVHKLTLLKLDIPDKKLFTWAKCLTSMPSKGQRLSVLYEFAPPNSYSQSIPATVLAINQDYSLLPDCHDAFTLNEIAKVPVGAMLRSIDGELQGILLEKSESAPEPDKTSPHACLPAVHIEAMRAKYRASHAGHR